MKQFEVAVGEGDTEIGRQEVAAATGEADLFLLKCQAAVDAWEFDLDETRDDLSQSNAKILGWVTCAAIAVSVLCFWMGAGQISLFAHALRWCRAR